MHTACNHIVILSNFNMNYSEQVEMLWQSFDYLMWFLHAFVILWCTQNHSTLRERTNCWNHTQPKLLQYYCNESAVLQMVTTSIGSYSWAIITAWFKAFRRVLFRRSDGGDVCDWFLLSVVQTDIMAPNIFLRPSSFLSLSHRVAASLLWRLTLFVCLVFSVSTKRRLNG